MKRDGGQERERREEAVWWERIGQTKKKKERQVGWRDRGVEAQVVDVEKLEAGEEKKKQ